MQSNKRVYPSERKPGKWLSYLLLFFSAVIVLSGLTNRGGEQPIIQPVATETPIPLEAAFDETPESRELTLPGGTWYALQLGAFETEAGARDLAEQYGSRGAAGYVWLDGRYRTLAAIYPSREDAQNVRQQLLSQHSIESYLYEVPIPALTVRMKGMKGQIDILQAAFSHAAELTSSLQALSVRMDRQELSVAEACEALNALKAQMELVALRLEQRFTTPRNAAVQGLIGLFRDFGAFAAKQDEGQSAVELGRQVKHEAIHSLYLTKEIVDTLGNT